MQKTYIIDRGCTTVDVRIATIENVNDLFELNTLFENTTTIELMKKCFVENECEVVCIAYIDNIAVGFCNGYTVKSMCYSENRADIESLYVKEEYRKTGVGKALLLCLEEAFIARGIFHFHINTHSNNTNALSLYNKIGYVKSGEVLLEKSITA